MRPAKRDLAPLLHTFRKLGGTELLPSPQLDRCPARTALDEAAAKVLGLDATGIADWRERLVREPTISNKAADLSS